MTIGKYKESERNIYRGSPGRDVVIGVDPYVDCVEVSDVGCNMGPCIGLVF